MRASGSAGEYADFAKIQLKVGKVLACEKVPKTDKLLKLTVDLGEGAPRTWTCGICGRESTLEQIGVTFGDAAVGSPLCPENDCTAIGWEYFTEVSRA